MQIGIQTPLQDTTFAELRDVWQAADELGFASAYTFDHFVALNPGQRPGTPGGVPDGPQFEGWIALAALAAATSRLQVGTLVSGVTYRHPAVLAKMAVTLDHATGGRAVLGLGAAWHETEHRMYGIDFPPVGERMGRLDEALTIFRRLCTEDEVDFAGRYHRLAGARFAPKPVRPAGVPILVGGSGERLKRIAARHASIFNSFSPPWDWAAVNADLDAKLIAAGRAPADLQRSAFVIAELSGSAATEDELVAVTRRTRGGTEEEVRRRILTGPPERMIAVLRSYEAAGVGSAIVNLQPPFDLAGLERFARDVLPAL